MAESAGEPDPTLSEDEPATEEDSTETMETSDAPEEGASEASSEPDMQPDSDEGPLQPPDPLETATGDDAKDQPYVAPGVTPATSEEEKVYKPHPLLVNPNQAQLDALDAELEEATKDMQEKQAVSKEVNEVTQAAVNVVNTLNRQIDSLHQADPHHHQRGIRKVIAQSNRARAARAARMAAFTSKVGVSPEQAAVTLNAKAPIDQALSGRKNPRPLNTGRAA